MTRRHWYILSLLMAAEIVAALETSMVLAALGAWSRIHGNPIGIGWIVSSYLLVSAASAALCGRLGDMYGRKRMLVTVVAIACIGSIVSAAGTSLSWIIAGRAIQGAAGAIIPLCYGLAREHLPRSDVPFAVGLIVATASAGSAVALLVGGVLTDHYGPQSIFIASAISTAFIGVLLAIGLPRSPPLTLVGKVDWLGGILFAPAVAALLLLFSNGSRWGWTSVESLVCASSGVGLIAVWIWHESRHPEPLIDIRLLADRRCALGNLIMFCAGVGVMQITQLTSLLLQQPRWTLVGLGMSATFVGLMKLPAVLSGAVSSVWAGWASGKHGGRFPILIGCAVMAIASALGAISHREIAAIFVVVCAAMMGITAAYAGIPNVIIEAVPADRTSEATGLMAVVRAMAQAIGAQVLAILFASSTIVSADGKSFPDEHAYTAAFWFMAAASLVAFALTLLIQRVPHAASELAGDRATS
jgi:MFS family permease